MPVHRPAATSAADGAGQLARPVWWRTGAVYQIYPRSFLDTDGDGIGDLHGIRRRLDHLAWLGVDAIWLSPIYVSPMRDNGYDVADHTDVDPVFGDLDTFDRLVHEAHRLGLRVLLDWVPNHTSDQHPWFRESRSSRSAEKRDWYVWRDGSPDRPPNNWGSAFGGPAWTWDEPTEQWYLHLFLPEQPDLDWHNPAVEAAMHDVLRFWLDRGVDGFRADVVHLIGKDPELPDLPAQRARHSVVGTHHDAAVHPLLQGVRAVLDEYPRDRMVVGEVNLRGAELLLPYYGDDDQLHLTFNFSLLHALWDAEAWREAVADATGTLLAHGAWPTWVLSNHDVSRHRTRLGGSEERARVAALLLLTLPGTPFLYQGEELGLEDADVPDRLRTDPDGRDPERAPVPWTADEPHHGWPSEPWLPFPPAAADRSVASQREDPDSVLHLYRRLLVERGRSPALTRGEFAFLDAPDGVLAYARRAGDDRRAVVANFTDEPRTVDVGARCWIEVASDRRGELEQFSGHLPPGTAYLLTS